MKLNQLIVALENLAAFGNIDVYDGRGNPLTLGLLSVEELRNFPFDWADTQILPDKFLVIGEIDDED